jgi:DNA-binding FadR family transcriptional regulator
MLQNSVLASRSLFSHAVDADFELTKASCRVAAALEEQFIAAGWPTGERIGSEEALARRFDVGSRIIDEAVRVLTMRGTARLRRASSNLIDLEVTAPEVDQVFDVLCGYSYLAGITEQHRNEALSFLAAVRERVALANGPAQNALALEFMARFVGEKLTPGAPPEGLIKERFHKFRAGQIANRIFERYFEPHFEPNRKIGSEAELSALYRADRSITRQAIRLLESAGLVTTVPGRGNGIFTNQPPSAPVSRLVCCYLASCGLPIAAAFEIFRAMSIEAISLAAQRACAADVNEFERNFAANWNESRLAQLPDIFSTEDCQFRAVRNPLIELYLRSLRGYVALTVEDGGGTVSKEMADCFVDYTRRVLDAMIRHEPAEAAHAHEGKLLAMRELESRHNPALARILYTA